jgi:hypothetical protein
VLSSKAVITLSFFTKIPSTELSPCLASISRRSGETLSSAPSQERIRSVSGSSTIPPSEGSGGALCTCVGLAAMQTRLLLLEVVVEGVVVVKRVFESSAEDSPNVMEDCCNLLSKLLLEESVL